MYSATHLRSFFRSWVLLLFIPAIMHAHSFGQGGEPPEKRVTLDIKNETLTYIFSQITAQTGFYFTGNADKLPKKTFTISVNHERVEKVLEMLLAGNGFSWIIKDNVVAVMASEEDRISKGLSKPLITNERRDSTLIVEGKIVNEKGEPLIGASVAVLNSAVGTTANNDGSFMLKGVTTNATLIISNIAYITERISVGNKKNLGLIVLKEAVSIMDEAVVIAYGTTSQRIATSPVFALKAKDIERQPVNNPLLALQGRVPGVFITQATGYAGSGVTIRIQGQNSISNGNDPLYVVDGVPYTSQLLPGINQIVGNSGTANDQNLRPLSGNPLTFINPSDIESITVLKDADATAIYGSRAANGAILITTKKGKSGKMKLEVNAQTGWGSVARKMKLLNNGEYLEMRMEALKNDNLSADPDKDYDLFNNYGWNNARNTDWQKVLIGNTARYSNYQASVSGGNENARILVGGTYREESSVLPTKFTDRKAAIHVNTDLNSNNQKLKFTFNTNYMADVNRLPGVDLTSYAITLPPTAPELYNADGSLNWALNPNGGSTWGLNQHPVSQLSYLYKNTTSNLTSNAILSYIVIPGLEVKSSFGYNRLQSKESQQFPAAAFSPEEKPFVNRSAAFADNSSNSWIIEPQLSYSKMSGGVSLNALVGGTIQQNHTSAVKLTGSGYPNDEVLGDLSNAADINLDYSNLSDYRYNALFARVNLNWRNELIFNLTGRRDGSSRFGAENPFHLFGSGAVAWLFTENRWLKDNLSFLSFGKVRASYGSTGSDQINDYRFLTLYVPTFYQPYQGVPGMLPQSFSNPYLQWEETRKLQMGLDLSFFKEKLYFSATYFRNRSSNQLLEYKLPIQTGFPSVISNFPAIVQNRGVELSVNSNNIKLGPVNWTTAINLTIPRNELIRFPELETSSYASLLAVGQPLSIIKAFKFAGVDATTGLYQFHTSDGKITSDPADPADKNAVVNTTPTYFGGFQNSFAYKSFSLDFLFQFVKQTGANYRFGFYPGYAESTYGNQPVYVRNRWREPGDVANVQRYNADFSAATPFTRATTSDAAYSDASYIRLKNISLVWSMPDSWLRSLLLKNAQVYFQSQNLITITSYKGLDPETLNPYTLPPLKMLVIGIRAGL